MMLPNVSNEAFQRAMAAVGWTQPVSAIPVAPWALPVMLLGEEMPRYRIISSNANAAVALAAATFLATPGGTVPAGKVWRVHRCTIRDAVTAGVYPAAQIPGWVAGDGATVMALHSTLSGITGATPYVYPLPTDTNSSLPLALLPAGAQIGVMGAPAGTNAGHYAAWLVEELTAS